MSTAWVTRVGARSPQGMTALQVAMGARTLALAPSATPFVDSHGGRIGMIRSRSIPDRVTGADRMVRLAAPALAEAAEDGAGPVTLVLALPAGGRADDGPDLGERVLFALGEALGRPLDRRSVVVRAGRAGGALALAAAIERAAAGAPQVIVGGVDTHFHEGVLRQLDDAERVHSMHVDDGFIPGEAAAFAAIAAGDARSLGRPPLARIAAVAVETEATVGTDEPNVGRALTTALARLLAGSEGGAGWVMTDGNGEPDRDREWRRAAHRARGALGSASELEVGQFAGDVGAASGPLALAVAATWWATACAPASRCVVMLASDGPERGGFVLEEGA